MEQDLHMGPLTLSILRLLYSVLERRHQTLEMVELLRERGPSFAEETEEASEGHLVSSNQEILFAIDPCIS